MKPISLSLALIKALIDDEGGYTVETCSLVDAYIIRHRCGINLFIHFHSEDGMEAEVYGKCYPIGLYDNTDDFEATRTEIIDKVIPMLRDPYTAKQLDTYVEGLNNGADVRSANINKACSLISKD